MATERGRTGNLVTPTATNHVHELLRLRHDPWAWTIKHAPAQPSITADRDTIRNFSVGSKRPYVRKYGVPRNQKYTAKGQSARRRRTIVQIGLRSATGRELPRGTAKPVFRDSIPFMSDSILQFLLPHQPHRRPQPCYIRAAQVCQQLHGLCQSPVVTRACPPTLPAPQVSRGATSRVLHDHAQVHRAATRRRALQPLH